MSFYEEMIHDLFYDIPVFAKYTFLNIGFSEENMFCLILKDNVFFFSLLPVTPTFDLNLRKKNFYDFLLVSFLCKNKLFVIVVVIL